jgi:Glycosyl transferase family 2
VTAPTVSAVVTAHDRRAYLAEAVASALAAGSSEVIVVRNFRGPIEGAEGRYRDLPCQDEETGIKEAAGAAVATGDLVAFLDDDDLWEPNKVERVRTAFGAEPNLVYYCHDQTPVDDGGRPVAPTHREWAHKDPGLFATWDGRDVGYLLGRIWPGNNSSTVVRREWALAWLPALREAGWSADTFWLVTALLSGQELRLDAEPLTRLRLHRENMSQTRGASPEAFRTRHATMCARFARSTATIARLATERRGPRSPLARYYRRKSVGFRFFAYLEEGVRPRRAAVQALLHGPGFTDRAVLGSALVAVASPAAARRTLYRSSLRRWRLG